MKKKNQRIINLMLRSDKNTATLGNIQDTVVDFLIMVLQILTGKNKRMLPLCYDDAVDSSQVFS